MKTTLHPNPATESQRHALRDQRQIVSAQCSQCQQCVNECQFLKTYGNPKTIADSYDPSLHRFLKQPFECSLCGLCTAVCPEQLNPVTMFLEMRRETFDRAAGDFPEHKGLLKYEKKGTSKRFSWYALPEASDTIFFPGCGLPGTRPEQTLKTFELLQHSIPTAGIVLDCCTKPSHDLGRQDYFHVMFGEMKQFLLEHGIKTVLVACPNCHQVFSDYAPEFNTRTIYEILDSGKLPDSGSSCETVNIHDPCVARFSSSMQDAVRSLTGKKGLSIVEAKHSRKTTLCCGEGGAVGNLTPELAQSWTRKRGQEMAGSRTITYCSGCTNSLATHGPTHHILDLLFSPEAALAGRAKSSKAPLTYLNRLKLKRKLKTFVPAAVTRERTFTLGGKSQGGLVKKLALLAIIIGAIVALRATGVTDSLQ